MINYQNVDSNGVGSCDYIRVKWSRKEIGRIYKENKMFHYRPRGCAGQLRSEEFTTLQQLKNYLEGK